MPGLGMGCAIDFLQGRGNRAPVPVGDEIQRIPEEMDDVGLDLCLEEHIDGRLREAFEVIGGGDENVLNAALA